MLFFELFPAFVLLVSLIVGVMLFLASRRAPNESTSSLEQPRRPVSAEPGDPRTGSRPSMRG
ncbi:MAG TPA: hypothetical protein VIK60_03365 [Vicinamibacterales bacterium]